MLAALITASAVGCSKWDMMRILRIAATRDTLSAKQMAAERAVKYATDPQSLERDMAQMERRFEQLTAALREGAGAVWGKKETKAPRAREYVKYTENYRSRASVDFDRGVITVETLARENPLDSLTNAVVTTLLTPDDPRAVDIFSARTVELGKTPFLYGEVQDHDRKNIRWSWRAERFARHLVDTGLRRRTIEAEGTRRLVRYVTIPMIPDHHTVRASKYRSVVEHFASRFSISKNLVYAIIKTESDFNPFAVSPASAFGLMQIVPWTAGRDVHRYLNNRDGTPSKEFLFNPENNIRYGTAYLHLLKYRYLETIRNPVSRSYCVIAAYNTGAGNVLRTFHPAGSEAPEKINGLEPLQVYDTLRSRLPTDEARGYLAKVLDAQKQFVRF